MRHFFLLFIVICSINPLSVVGAENKLSISAATFGQRENYTSIKLSPDGNRMASFRPYKGKIRLITQSLDPADKGKWHVISIDKGEYNWFRWLSNDRIAVSIRIPEAEYGVKFISTRLFAIDWDKKNPINLVKKQRRAGFLRVVSQLQDNLVSLLPDDPDHILLALDTERQNYPFVYKVNIHNAKRRRAVTIASHIVAWKADKKGIVRIGYGAYKKNSRIIYRESANDKWHEIANYDAVDDEPPFRPVGFSPDPKILYVSKTDENGFQAYYTYNYQTQKFVEKIAFRDDADVTGIEFDEQGNILGYGYRDDRYHWVNKDKLGQRIARMMDRFFPEQKTSIISHSKDKKKFIIRVSSPVNPGDYYFLDLNTNKLDWFSEVYPGLDDDRLSPMTSVRYKARDGLDIPAYLSLPLGVKDPKDLPTIIMPHGGPFSRDTYGFDYWVQFLTTRGYAVLQMNYRGSTGLGAAYEQMGRNEWGGKMLDDINDGARWMVAEGYADPGRICIVGGSYGGYAALQTLIKEPGLYKCSVAMAPVTSMSLMFSDFKKYLGLRERYMPYVRNKEGSSSDISPYDHIDKINVPVLLLHGTADRSVDYKHGKMFAKRMKRKKKDIRFVTFDGGDHYLSNARNRIKFLAEMEKFLKKNLW